MLGVTPSREKPWERGWYSDWLNFLWHSINIDSLQTVKSLRRVYVESKGNSSETVLFEYVKKKISSDYTLSETNSISSSVSSLAVMARNVCLRSSLPR